MSKMTKERKARLLRAASDEIERAMRTLDPVEFDGDEEWREGVLIGYCVILDSIRGDLVKHADYEENCSGRHS